MSSENKDTSGHLADRLKKFAAPTVWHEFTPLAAEQKAINLGQGFPGWKCPDFAKEALKRAVDADENQYTRSAGHTDIVAELSKTYSPRIGRELNPLTEIVVTSGATEALCAMILGIVNPGDEVVVLEPAFDIYQAQVEMAGGTVKSVPYRLDEATQRWYIDMDEFRAAFTDKTTTFIFNNPHNPTGKVFSKQELTEISEVLKAFPKVRTLTDEVYEYLVFDGHEHVHLASLPGMWDRVVTISSAGKTFSATGWKVGWCIGPEELVRPAAVAHQWITFSLCTPVQPAVAECLRVARQPYKGFDTYYDWLLAEYKRKRDLLIKSLKGAGIKPIEPEGSFFIMGDTSAIKVPPEYDDGSVTRDWALCRYLVKELKVAAIPPSAFYCDENKHLAANFARFAFCKDDADLIEAEKRLSAIKK